MVVDEADEVMERIQDQTDGKVESEVATGEVIETRDDIIVQCICMKRSIDARRQSYRRQKSQN